MIRAHPVQVEQRLVHGLLKLQGAFKGFGSTAPLIAFWFLQQNVGQKNTVTIINLEFSGAKAWRQNDCMWILSRPLPFNVWLQCHWVALVCQQKISDTAHTPYISCRFYTTPSYVWCDSGGQQSIHPLCEVKNAPKLNDKGVTHTLTSCRKILPPLWFCIFINFSACSRSSCDWWRKNLAKLCNARSSRSK